MDNKHRVTRGHKRQYVYFLYFRENEFLFYKVEKEENLETLEKQGQIWKCFQIEHGMWHVGALKRRGRKKP